MSYIPMPTCKSLDLKKNPYLHGSFLKILGMIYAFVVSISLPANTSPGSNKACLSREVTRWLILKQATWVWSYQAR